MKKKILMFLSVLLVITLIGCGTQKTDENSNSETGENVQTEETVQNEEPADDTIALSVENDQFTFDKLVEQIGVQETELSAFLGATETAVAYNAQIFGQNVRINVNVQEKVVQSMELVFEDVDADSVTIAVEEQLGQDGQEVGGNLQWTYEENTIVLSKDANGCVINIQK